MVRLEKMGCKTEGGWSDHWSLKQVESPLTRPSSIRNPCGSVEHGRILVKAHHQHWMDN